jgi:hypothetical protein
MHPPAGGFYRTRIGRERDEFKADSTSAHPELKANRIEYWGVWAWLQAAAEKGWGRLAAGRRLQQNSAVRFGTFSLLDAVLPDSEAAWRGQKLQTHLAAFSRAAVDMHSREQQLVVPAHTVRIAAQKCRRESGRTRGLVGVEDWKPQGDVVGLKSRLSVTEELVQHLRKVRSGEASRKKIFALSKVNNS